MLNNSNLIGTMDTSILSQKWHVDPAKDASLGLHSGCNTSQLTLLSSSHILWKIIKKSSLEYNMNVLQLISANVAGKNFLELI